MRRLLLACLLVALAATPASAAPRLGAVNTLSSVGPGAVEVEIPEAVTLDMNPNKNLSVELRGSAPVIGYLLRKIAANGAIEDTPYAIVGARGTDSRLACNNGPFPADQYVMTG